MNNKGQALVEFVIILPILIIVLVFFSEILNVAQKKQKLEQDADFVVNAYQKNKKNQIESYKLKNKFDLSINIDDDVEIILKQKIKARLLFFQEKEIVVKRYILNE